MRDSNKSTREVRLQVFLECKLLVVAHRVQGCGRGNSTLLELDMMIGASVRRQLLRVLSTKGPESMMALGQAESLRVDILEVFDPTKLGGVDG